MRALLFVPDLDTPGKKDMSQAFLPSALGFARFHGLDDGSVRRFPAGAPLDTRRATCTLALKQTAAPLDVVGFFCHGWKGGMQAGFLRAHTLMLARILATAAKSPAFVLLFACDTGRDLDEDTADDVAAGPGGDGGFADNLRDALEVLGRKVTILAHTTRGHSLTNPYARYFAPDAGGRGGQWYVEPGSILWGKWVAALKAPRATLPYRYYAMTPDEIAHELRGGSAPSPLVA